MMCVEVAQVVCAALKRWHLTVANNEDRLNIPIRDEHWNVRFVQTNIRAFDVWQPNLRIEFMESQQQLNRKCQEVLP
jgi:hypothetical protein